MPIRAAIGTPAATIPAEEYVKIREFDRSFFDLDTKQTFASFASTSRQWFYGQDWIHGLYRRDWLEWGNGLRRRNTRSILHGRGRRNCTTRRIFAGQRRPHNRAGYIAAFWAVCKALLTNMYNLIRRVVDDNRASRRGVYVACRRTACSLVERVNARTRPHSFIDLLHRPVALGEVTQNLFRQLVTRGCRLHAVFRN